MVQSLTSDSTGTGGIEVDLGEKFADQRGAGVINLFDGLAEIDTAELPGIGNGSSEAILLGDYTCRHCRILHRRLAELDGVSVVKLPVSRNPGGVRVWELMLVAWRVRPELFADMDRRIAGGLMPADANEIERILTRRLGAEGLQSALALHAPWAREQLVIGARVLAETEKRTGKSGVPQLIFGERVLVGSASHEKLAVFFQKGADPQAQAPTATEVALSAPPALNDQVSFAVPGNSPKSIPIYLAASRRRDVVRTLLVPAPIEEGVPQPVETDIVLPEPMRTAGVQVAAGKLTANGKVPLRITVPSAYDEGGEIAVSLRSTSSGGRHYTFQLTSAPPAS